MQKKHIEERNIVLPHDYKNDISFRVTGFASEEGLYAIPVVPVAVRCRYDIQEMLGEIVENPVAVEKILSVLDEEFPMIMSDYRIKARIDDSLKFEPQKTSCQGLF